MLCCTTYLNNLYKNIIQVARHESTAIYLILLLFPLPSFPEMILWLATKLGILAGDDRVPGIARRAGGQERHILGMIGGCKTP